MLRKLPRLITVLLSLFFFLPTKVSAAYGLTSADASSTLEDATRANSIKVVLVASALITIFVVLTFLFKNASGLLKKILFVGIVVPTLLASVFLAGSTVRLNLASSSGGPVHWHAQFEIWDCGKKLDIIDPKGFSNKVGTAALHEHNDGWIHLEGVIIDQKDASLGKFFQVVGGQLTSTSLEVPTNSGVVSRQNGDLCPDGIPGSLQVFVDQTEGKIFTQKKLDDPGSYVLSPHGRIPPGDCIIVEFGSEDKEKTEKLCEQYKLQVLKGNLYGN
ncbi:MAG: hypothetical protein WD231_05225 [Candidatus Woykebacteria bacterium]